MILEEELASYLRQKGFLRFVEAWTYQYKRLNRLGGKIVLKDLSDEESECLSGFLGLDLSSGSLSITYLQFLKRLNKTRFKDADFFKTLEILNQSLIYSKKELKELHDLEFDEFKDNLFNMFLNTRSYDWLDDHFKNDRHVKRYFNHDKTSYHSILENVCQALNHLPVFLHQYELLPVFSQNITRDPHYFDEDLQRDLLLKGIMFLTKNDSTSVVDQFIAGGLLKDDLSNYCYICHIEPVHFSLSWHGFYKEYEPWNMNLYNINHIKDHFVRSNIYIFENPSVFRMMCDFIKERHINAGLVCSNGQINFCTYLLLDKLKESGCHLYYAGDFDPEGLLIADKLKQRYVDLKLFCYEKRLFKKIMVRQFDISSKRIQMLKSICDDELKSIADFIRKEEAFGYQEGLIEYYQKEMDLIEKVLYNQE